MQTIQYIYTYILNYNRRKISPIRQTTNLSPNMSVNVDIIKATEQGGIWSTLLSRTLLDCTVGARSAKLKVSTRKSTKHVFGSPERLQTWFLLSVMFSGCLFPEHPVEYLSDSSAREEPHDGAWQVVATELEVESWGIIGRLENSRNWHSKVWASDPNKLTRSPIGPPANLQWYPVFWWRLTGTVRK